MQVADKSIHEGLGLGQSRYAGGVLWKETNSGMSSPQEATVCPQAEISKLVFPPRGLGNDILNQGFLFHTLHSTFLLGWAPRDTKDVI